MFLSWFIKESNRDVIDILTFWYDCSIGPFRPEWFDQSIDRVILQDYSKYVDKLLRNELEHWKRTRYGRLAYLIVADQFSRNIARHRTIDTKTCDSLAFQLAVDMITQRTDLEYPTMAERMFILLPLRHTKINTYIRFVLDVLDEYKMDKFYCSGWLNRSPLHIKQGHCISVLERFREATIKNLTDLDAENIILHPTDITISTTEYSDILDLDYTEREKMGDGATLIKNVENYIKSRNYKKLGVSLSGGIDSMVVLDLLIRVLGKDNVIAIHVAHSNREIAKKELEFIEKWCSVNSVVLVYRDVDYMNRENVDRNFYEDESKKIRFSMYRYCVSKYGLDGVCLGHHRDDIGENVMMNILTSRDAIDLKGMEKEKIMFNVNIIRPLLDVKKNVVWAYGRDKTIPCFKDSTPDWSWRGVLRRQIYPKLNERVGDIHDILAKLGDKSEEWNTIINKMIYEPIFSSVKYYPYGCAFKVVGNMPNSFYTRILLEVFYKMKARMITEKNQRGFIEWLGDSDAKKHYQLSNGFRALKGNDGLICFARDELFDKAAWVYDVFEGATDEKRGEFTVYDLLGGKFIFTEEYSDVQRVNLVSSFEKGDRNRKIYNGFHWLPKLTSGKHITSDKKALVILHMEKK
jgi:tRNA(Ile)-lysidine synthetase-like protein